jgi:hypothetical protein
MKCAISSVLLLAALALGQNWVVEQLDSTAASQSPVELVKAADGRLWVGYQTKSGVVRVACRGDSGWSMTDVRSGYVATNTFSRPFLAAGPHGELCLSCASSDSGWLFRLMQDTWRPEPYPFLNASTSGTLAYDTTGRLYTSFSPRGGEFWVGHEDDSGWTAGFVAEFTVYGYFWVDIGLLTAAADGSPWFFGYGFYDEDPIHHGEEVALMHFDGDTWARVWGRYDSAAVPVGLTPHRAGVGILTDYDGSIQCDSEPIAPVSDISVAALAYSAEDVPLVAWVPLTFSALPTFAFKTNRWHTESIPGPAGIGGLDIDVDAAGQVVIVYSTQDSGLWCARGADVVGVENNRRPQVPSRKLEPTILSGASGVGRLASSVVFDAMGRRVANPRSGIYFVREAQAQAVRKVVVRR